MKLHLRLNYCESSLPPVHAFKFLGWRKWPRIRWRRVVARKCAALESGVLPPFSYMPSRGDLPFLNKFYYCKLELNNNTLMEYWENSNSLTVPASAQKCYFPFCSCHKDFLPSWLQTTLLLWPLTALTVYSKQFNSSEYNFSSSIISNLQINPRWPVSSISHFYRGPCVTPDWGIRSLWQRKNIVPVILSGLEVGHKALDENIIFIVMLSHCQCHWPLTYFPVRNLKSSSHHFKGKGETVPPRACKWSVILRSPVKRGHLF